MIRFSACIEVILGELPFLDRIAAVAENGLPAFEFWDWRSKDIKGILDRKEEYGLSVSTFMAEPSGRIVDSSTSGEFVKGVKDSIDVAHELGCSMLMVFTGSEMEDVPRMVQHNNIVKCLREAAEFAKRSEIKLLLEPLNVLVDHKGYYLSSSSEAFKIIREVDSPNVRVLYDIYHQQITEGNVINTITNNINLIGHFHVADVPGRHEPGTGEINYANIFKKIEMLGYDGFVGLEFIPLTNSRDAIEKVKKIVIN